MAGYNCKLEDREAVFQDHDSLERLLAFISDRCGGVKLPREMIPREMAGKTLDRISAWGLP